MKRRHHHARESTCRDTYKNYSEAWGEGHGGPDYLRGEAGESRAVAATWHLGLSGVAFVSPSLVWGFRLGYRAKCGLCGKLGHSTAN